MLLLTTSMSNDGAGIPKNTISHRSPVYLVEHGAPRVGVAGPGTLEGREIQS